MQIKNVLIETERGEPAGILADIHFDGCNTVLQVFRDWDNPQWFVYDLEFGEGLTAGIDNLEHKYPVAFDSDLHAALEREVDVVRATFTPA